jgi:hypothetical protein
MKEDVWLALPSANIEMAKKTFPVWKSKGYKIAVVVPDRLLSQYSGLADIIVAESSIGGYRGWPKAVNYLSGLLSDYEIIIAAGDDMYPDSDYEAHQLRLQFVRHFGGTFGVMQPYGDKFGSMACDTCEQICGSSWLGKEFREKINQGKGPMWEEYWHMWADTELYQVATKYNCLWIRGDLKQYHEHRLRGTHKFHPTIPSGNTKQAEKIYRDRKSNNFPNSEPLP